MRKFRSKTAAIVVAAAMATTACGEPLSVPEIEKEPAQALLVAPIDIRSRLAHEFEWAKSYPVPSTWNVPDSSNPFEHEFPVRDPSPEPGAPITRLPVE